MGEFSVSLDELFPDGRTETEVCHLVHHTGNDTNGHASAQSPDGSL